VPRPRWLTTTSGSGDENAEITEGSQDEATFTEFGRDSVDHPIW